MNLRVNRKSLIGLICFLLLLAHCGKKMSEEQYLTEAQKYMNNGRFFESITMYNELIEKFPNSTQVPKTLFMIGFIYANELQDSVKAKAYYSTFLNRFPDNELATSVRWEMTHLGSDVNTVLASTASDSAGKDSTVTLKNIESKIKKSAGNKSAKSKKK